MESSFTKLKGIKNFFKGKEIKQIQLFAIAESVLVFTTSTDPQPNFYFFKDDKVATPSIDETVMYQYHIDKVSSLDISPCGRYAVTGHSNGQIILWDPKLLIHITSYYIPTHRSITYTAIRHDCKAILISLNNFQLHQYMIISPMNYLTIKQGDQMVFESRITGIKAASSCDLSIHFFIVSFTDKIIIIRSEEDMTQIVDIPFVTPLINIIGNDYKFIVSVATEEKITLVQIREDGEHTELYSHVFDSKIKSVSFLSSHHLLIKFNKKILILHTLGEICSTIPLDSATDEATSLGNKIFLTPHYQITFKTWKDHISQLYENKQFKTAITEAYSIFTDKSIIYYCENKDEIVELVKSIMISFLKTIQGDLSQIQFIAKYSIDFGLFEYILTVGFSHIPEETQNLLAIAMLDFAKNHSYLTSTLFRIVSKIKTPFTDTLEDALLKVSLPPSFTEEMISIAQSLHFNRLIFHHFDCVFGDIFPAFSLIIDNGLPSEISFAIRHVFLSGNFTPSKTLTCTMWLFTPDYSRLRKCFSSDWITAADYIQNVLFQCPIQFSSIQSLNLNDVISVSLLCFTNAPLDKGTNLFELLARATLENNVIIPSESINTILNFIFNNNKVTRTLREKLLLKIINNDYKNEMKLIDFNESIITSGFINASRIIYESNKDFSSYIIAILFSDNPYDALTILEENDTITIDILYLCFIPLLLLDAKRFIKLIIEKFSALHPKFINEIENPNLISIYYESLIDCGYAKYEDYIYYLLFISKVDTNRFVDFIIKKKAEIVNDNLLKLFEDNKIYIGLTVVYMTLLNWIESYKFYLKHLNENGLFNVIVSKKLIENILDINENPTEALCKILRPIIKSINVDDNIKLILDLIKLANNKMKTCEVISAVLSLSLGCSNTKMKSALLAYVKKVGGCCFVEQSSLTADVKFRKNIEMIYEKCNGKSISDGKVSAVNTQNGIVVISTIEEQKGEEMDKETSDEIKSALQRAESILISRGNRIPQNKEATVVLFTNK